MKDTYKIDGSIVVCHSKSGKTYHLTKSLCDCMGFSFHRTCRHYEEAKALGLFAKLATKVAKQTPFNFKTPYIVEARKRAVAWFLGKHGIKYTQAKIDRLEPLVAIDMDVKKFLAMAK